MRDTDDSKLLRFAQLAALQHSYLPLTSLAVDRMTWIAGVTVACVALATILVSALIYARRFVTRSLGLDDLLLVASLVSSSLFFWLESLALFVICLQYGRNQYD